jgi:hypothetical protein
MSFKLSEREKERNKQEERPPKKEDKQDSRCWMLPETIPHDAITWNERSRRDRHHPRNIKAIP